MDANRSSVNASRNRNSSAVSAANSLRVSCCSGPEVAALGINRAKRTDVKSIETFERRASVEAQMGRTHYLRVVRKAAVAREIRHDIQLIGQDRVREFRRIAGDLLPLDDVTCFMPLPVLIYEGDESDRNFQFFAVILSRTTFYKEAQAEPDGCRLRGIPLESGEDLILKIENS
jgi:hypothetical protein